MIYVVLGAFATTAICAGHAALGWIVPPVIAVADGRTHGADESESDPAWRPVPLCADCARAAVPGGLAMVGLRT